MILELALAVYRKIDPHQILFPKGISKFRNINGIMLKGNMLDPSFALYEQHYDETVNRLYSLIATEHNPDLVIDIGANYGFISFILKQYLPDSTYILIEPNKKLIPYLMFNNYINNSCIH